MQLQTEDEQTGRENAYLIFCLPIMSNVERRLKEFRQRKEEEKKRQERRDNLWHWITFAGVRNRWRNNAAGGDPVSDVPVNNDRGGESDNCEFLEDDEDAPLCPQTPLDAAILLVKVRN